MDFALLDAVFDCASAISAAEDLPAVSRTMDEVGRLVAAERWMLVHHDRASGALGAALLANDLAVANRYFAEDVAAIDPIPDMLAHSRRAVRRAILADSPNRARFEAFLDSVGARDFITVPIFEDGVIVASLNFTFPDREATAIAGAVAGIIGPTLYKRLVDLGIEPPVSQSGPLTPRELECLIWASVGKTSWEIAEILKVAERTVNAHLARITQKLGVSNRTQAVAEGLRRGLIR